MATYSPGVLRQMYVEEQNAIDRPTDPVPRTDKWGPGCPRTV